WVDSVMNSLTPEQRIAQLFMVAAYSNKGAAHVASIDKLVEETKIGGLIFFQGGPIRQAKLTNRWQAKAKVPLLVSIDGEWGLAMRLDSTIKYPRQMTLGAIQDEQLIYRMGEDIARQCKRLGVHVNLAPVVDVNVNPKNPVINSRSFGESRENVAEKALAYMRGMQDHQVLANAKHFPGHGDTDRDSHKTLPVINHSKHRIDSIELYPFKALIQEGLGSMMVAHLFIPQLDSTKNQASTLSKPIVTGLLKQELQFKGLVFTDALNMKGVSNFNQPGEADLKALLAGNDVLLFSADVPKAIAMIKGAVERGEISQEEIDQRCRKILAAKQWVGLDDYAPIDREGLYEDLNHAAYDITRRQLVEHSLTLLESRHGAIPLKRLDTLKIASVAIGAKEQNVFQKTLNDYAQIEHFKLGKNASAEEFKTLRALLKDFNLVVVSVHNTNQRPSRNFGITKRTREMVRTLMREQRVVLDVFANPYSIPSFGDLSALDGLVVSYQDDALTQAYSAQLLFGGIAARGKLPVTVSARYPVGAGIQTEQVRFKYTVPEEVGIVSADLDRIEAIAQSGIDRQAYPGCQVLVAKEGKVIYQRSFGHFTYEEKIPVTNRSIYDLASITKIAGTLPAVMRLSDAGNVNIDRNLCDYLPDLVDTTE
ncbi:MAG: glycoside hydrolase family 3 N-terminal domain-containing protein, partial [Bacteroidota bacterium]